ncbi:MAG: hypothetical protein IAG10_06810 [Planctomycetaceae bacterium]|nr:hypothetical protein [Planctomycetaceae bacterium]
MIAHQRSVFFVALVALSFLGISNSSFAGDAEAFAKRDVNDDGVLSGKEAAPFLLFDTDSDGEVTKTEYVAGVTKLRKQMLVLPDEELFSVHDKNEDGVLSGTEMIAFEVYDADGDGELTLKEFKSGRDTERKPAGPSREELLRRFREFDKNEDGRLSGKEMVGYEKLDSDGDRRVSEKEFVAGFSETPAEPAVDPLAVFLEMIRTSDPTTFLKACDPEYAKKLDRPILKFFMESVVSTLGTLEPSAKDALRPMEETIDDKAHTVYMGQLEFKEGKADAGLIVYQNRIVGFRLEPPVLNDVHDRLHTAIGKDKEFAKSTAEFYTPRCEEFIRLILGVDDDKAFAMYHEDVQNQLGRDKVQNLFEVFRTNCGTFKGIELESIRVNFDGDGKGENFKLTHLVRGSKQNYLATTTFQIIGLSAHIDGLAVKPEKADSDSPRPDPDKPAAFKWVKVLANTEGVTFEMPGKPKRTADEDTQRVFYRVDTEDKSSAWTVCIETKKENLEAEAKTLFDALEKQLVTSLEGELLDSDEANAGDHPGRVTFVKMKDAVFYVERTVIVGRRIYRFRVFTSEHIKRQREEACNHFFESAKFLETDDDVPAPPAPPTAAPSKTPVKMPKLTAPPPPLPPKPPAP